MCADKGFCDYHIDLKCLEKQSYSNFESEVFNINKRIVMQLEDGLKVKKNNYHGNVASFYDDELRDLIEKNNDLRQQIDTKLEDVSRQETEYTTYKTEKTFLSQEIKETHEAFLTAKKRYKKCLKMYYTIESRNEDEQTVFVQFFTESKKDYENYSVRLLRNTKTSQYQLISTTPMLPIMKELQQKLQEINDVPGALCTIRKAFKEIKDEKEKTTQNKKH